MKIRALIFGTCLFLWACHPKEASLDIEEGYKIINGAQIYYKTMGSGEPVIVIHGGPGLDHSYMLPQMRDLAKSYKLIFYDQRACGRSSIKVSPASISIRGFIADLDGLRQALELDKVHILAHSWGGLLAMNYAISYPQYLKSMTLVSSLSASSEDREAEIKVFNCRVTKEDSVDRANIIASEGFRNNKPEAFEQFFRVLFRKEFFNRDLANSLTLTFQDSFKEGSTMLQYLGEDMAHYDLYDSLKAVSQPVLLIYGDYDPLSEIAGPRLQASLPAAILEIIPQCGHFPFVEKPQEFFTLVREFIK